MTDEELDEYLTNWGRWSRECKTPSRSFLARLMAEAGSLPQEAKTVQVDIKKALQVTRAWRGMPATTYTDKCIKALIGIFYAYPVSQENMLLIMRKQFKLRMKYRDFDPFIERGRIILKNRLEKILWEPIK